MSEKTVLVTGATDGIGLKTAEMLLDRGARVILHGRRQERIDAAMKTLAKHGALGDPVRADFADLADVRKMAQTLAARGERIDVLLNNAGIFERTKKKSQDGFELTFAVNHLAPFALTHALLASPIGKDIERVVNVSSMAHGRGTLDLDDLSYERRRYDGYEVYSASKLANILFTVELSKRVKRRKFSTNALHPGVVSTKLLTDGFGFGGSDTLEESSRTSVLLSLDPIGGDVSGRYFVHERESKPSAAARDEALARALYEKSCTLTDTKPL